MPTIDTPGLHGRTELACPPSEGLCPTGEEEEGNGEKQHCNNHKYKDKTIDEQGNRIVLGNVPMILRPTFYARLYLVSIASPKLVSRSWESSGTRVVAVTYLKPVAPHARRWLRHWQCRSATLVLLFRAWSAPCTISFISSAHSPGHAPQASTVPPASPTPTKHPQTPYP